MIYQRLSFWEKIMASRVFGGNFKTCPLLFQNLVICGRAPDALCLKVDGISGLRGARRIYLDLEEVDEEVATELLTRTYPQLETLIVTETCGRNLYDFIERNKSIIHLELWRLDFPLELPKLKYLALDIMALDTRNGVGGNILNCRSLEKIRIGRYGTLREFNLYDETYMPNLHTIILSKYALFTYYMPEINVVRFKDMSPQDMTYMVNRVPLIFPNMRMMSICGIDWHEIFPVTRYYIFNLDVDVLRIHADETMDDEVIHAMANTRARKLIFKMNYRQSYYFELIIRIMKEKFHSMRLIEETSNRIVFA